MSIADILIDLEFAEPQPFPTDVAPGTIQATTEGAVYTMEIADDDLIWDLLARCEGCGNAASVSVDAESPARWCRDCAP